MRLHKALTFTAAAVAIVAIAVPVVGFAAGGMSMGGAPIPRSASPMSHITSAQRFAAARRAQAVKALDALNPLKLLAGTASLLPAAVPTLDPLGTPDYFNVPNWAYSPLPQPDGLGGVVAGTGIRKFVDSLPGLTAAGANDLGQYIPVAVPDTTTYPGSDYYEIELVEYTEQLHKDLPPTKLRGYKQVNTTDPTISKPNYLGPLIVAQRNRPVRIKFTNKLPVGSGGNLFLPVDTTVMGAGKGPTGQNYKQNRGTIHLHGGNTPWISDGTPHQWTTPANEVTPYPKGVSTAYVPDMWFNSSGHAVPKGTAGASNNPGAGSMTFYYTNQQSARLMFYHDHSYGITRLNVYAGEAAGYLLTDAYDQVLQNGGEFKSSTGTTVTVPADTIPTEQVPLVIQDKTFVPNDSQLAATDPTWDKAHWGGLGSLWFPHVYMPNQDPKALDGVAPMGRWDYGPWMYPPFNPMHSVTSAGNPGTPNPSIVPEAFMDTPLVNGTAYPYMKVGRKAYRFRILNASNDRFLNLQLYYAKSNTIDSTDASGNPTLQKDSGEVKMVPAYPHPGDPNWPSTWPTDGRDGGVPDPTTAGPDMIQIGAEGGFLPSATVIPANPINYEYNRRVVTILNVTGHGLFLAPAERADIIVDFSQVPDGAKLILYNDAPAPVPGFDSRTDLYTGDLDQTEIGGPPSTLAGYGPNNRTIMQFQASGPAVTPFNVAPLASILPKVFKASEDPIIFPEKAYGAAKDKYIGLNSNVVTFTPAGSASTVTMKMPNKAIVELFDKDYGRMNATLGIQPPVTNPLLGLLVPFGYIDPPTEKILDSGSTSSTAIGSMADGTQIWRISHNGVDTHAMHFHLFNVQIINRVGIDGSIRLPDANELGWKETVRLNPGEDAIVALRPVHQTLPWKIGNSYRLLDPTSPAGSTGQFSDYDSSGRSRTTTNTVTNFGWEYVWHCHLLGHEENDMMRPMVFQVAPQGSSGLALTTTGTGSASKVVASWKNNWTHPTATSIVLQRAKNSAFTSGLTTFTLGASSKTKSDTSTAGKTKYYYRVRAENAVSYSGWTSVKSITTK